MLFAKDIYPWHQHAQLWINFKLPDKMFQSLRLHQRNYLPLPYLLNISKLMPLSSSFRAPPLLVKIWLFTIASTVES